MATSSKGDGIYSALVTLKEPLAGHAHFTIEPTIAMNSGSASSRIRSCRNIGGVSAKEKARCEKASSRVNNFSRKLIKTSRSQKLRKQHGLAVEAAQRRLGKNLRRARTSSSNTTRASAWSLKPIHR